MPDGSSSEAPVMIPGPRIRRNFFKALNIVLLPSRFLRGRGVHPFVPGNIQAQIEPCSPERAVRYLFLEHGELWDEHLVDDVHDAVVRDHVRLKHMPTIDLDAFSYRGGDRVGSDIAKGVSAGSDFFLPQGNLRDVRPHSEPLSLKRLEEEAIEQVVCGIIPWHDVILEYSGQLSR